MEERATLLDSLEALIQDGVATIPDDGSVELVEMAGKAASADLYEKMVLHCRGEISIALLGQNQTTEASANRASSVSGLEVTKDLRDGDAEMVSAAFNQLIRWVTELNWGAAQGPTFSMWDQKDQDTLQAGRDKSNFEAGAKFTNAYWMRAYGYQEGDLLPETALAPAALVQAATKSIANTQGASFSEASQDPVASATDTLVTASAPQWAAMVAQLQTLVDQAPSLSALQQTLTQAYGAMDSADLVKLMAAAYALAELKGIDAAAL
jgi:phage gp29-like protein